MKRYFLPWISITLTVAVLEAVGRHLGLFALHTLAYDKLLHFLGGCACGVFGVAFATWHPWDIYASRKTHLRRIWIGAILAAIVIGVGWEILEYYVPAFGDASDYDWFDTTGDLIFDIVGGIVAAIVYRVSD